MENISCKNVYCTDCDYSIISSVHHCLFECTALHAIRETEWNIAKNFMPIALINELEELSPQQKTIFILKGMCETYIVEFRLVYNALLNFVHQMYSAKKQLHPC